MEAVAANEVYVPYLEPRCSVCQLPPIDREAFHNDASQGSTYPELIQKYFPSKRVDSMKKTLSIHFNKHYNMEKATASLCRAMVPAQGAVPLPTNEQRVFVEAAKERITAIHTIEQSMRLIMDKINYIEDDWLKTHTATKCDKCGRADENTQNLGKLLSCIRELRELSSEWIKIKNPMETLRQFFSETFSLFVDDIMIIYVDHLTEKSKVARDAVNSFLSKEISEPLLARRIVELEDFGAQDLATKAQVKFKEILTAALKKMA